ncbi:rRNA methyltransferase [Pseudonocardia endophytica]|uniref:rRNA methyltransferase AviRa n=1 Tax=Pseudonocardia endophytica TaxID=401976 RepID=A0A4R1HGD8_PSEEN|nr:rRNA methyltransferase [Pseudonocardia endophytica]TCK19921.1 RRNA methyltransferase AviRa [Pseudonocardia endophytica]
MRYHHAPAADHGALDAVLVSAPGRPTLPVRLTLELFGRALSFVGDGTGPVTVWDPCCGAGTTLAVLGLCRGSVLSGLLGSDVDPSPLDLARRNLALLDPGGLDGRARDLDALAARHGKASYTGAASAVRGLGGAPVSHEVAVADATDPAATAPLVARHRPHVVIADLPHGIRTSWSGSDDAASELVTALAAVLTPDAVIAMAGLGRKLVLPSGTRALDRLRVGHRAAAIARAGDVSRST